MKRKIRVPFFEIGVKNYLYGDEVLKLAVAADRAAEKYDIDVMFIAPYADIRRVSEKTKNLIIIAPYMDILPPGRGMADVLPESLKAAGAEGVCINHCERPMTLEAIRKTIQRANDLEMLSFACADTISEAKAIAQFHPDIINPEPTELIGQADSEHDLSYVEGSIRAVKEVFRDILVEQAAGISSPGQVYELIRIGAEGVGAASGICCAEDPAGMAASMIESVRKALDDMREEAGKECV
ncbi:MAG: triose-phosphate isomerase [Bilifractor sp.]|jgi:triosephosphate isomerase